MLNKLYPAVSLALSGGLLPVFLCYERGRCRIGERYGRWKLGEDFAKAQADRGLVWFHGASLGEMRGLTPVIERFRKRFPDVPVLVTVTSPSALPLAQQHADEVHLLPFDSPMWVERVVKNLSVRMFVCGEVEIWPTLYSALAEQGARIMLVNARMSFRSFQMYRRFESLFGPLLSMLERVLVADRASLERFEWLGVHERRVRLLGNAKYDQLPSLNSSQAREAFRREFFANDAPVAVLASVWPGEERVWFPAIGGLVRRNAHMNVLVAPRHTERFEYFANELGRAGISFVRRSDLARGDASPLDRPGVVLLDTLGELEPAYSFAQFAFIGGSIRKIGGHNPLEAAAYGVALAMGPHRNTVRDIAEQLKECSALFEVHRQSDAERVLALLQENPGAVVEYGARAKKVWQANQGAADRIVHELAECFERS